MLFTGSPIRPNLQEITRSMKALALEKIYKINTVLSDSSCPHNGLLGGSLGLLYYYYHAADILKDPALLEQGETMLAAVFEDLNGEDARLNGAAFSNGATGLAYVVNNLQSNGLIDFDINSEFADLDRYLFDTACEQLDKGEIDYLHGAMGAFYYFASRAQNETVNTYLNTLAGIFLDKAIPSADGLYFTNHSLERLGDHKADLGLAHGLSGLLLLLIAAWPHLKDPEKAAQTLRKGIAFILQFEVPADTDQQRFSLFPFTVERAKPLNLPNRMAWCYGDLNIVLLLYRAGKLLQDNIYLETAERIGKNTLNRKSEQATQSSDSHFCHGSSGLAQIYNCLYTETGDPGYKEAYAYWITETLSLVDREIEAGQYRQNPVSLLDGWPGVALVLTGYVSEEKQRWADVFLL